MRLQSVVLQGHVTPQDLGRALAALDTTSPSMLVVDALQMTGYDSGARDAFVAWNAKHKRSIAAVAVLTDKTLWRVVIAAMALASGQQMRAFREPREARAWAAALPETARPT